MSASAAVPFGPCVRCGHETATRFGDVFICRACYEVRSSCCPEFGPDDLAADCLGDAVGGAEGERPASPKRGGPEHGTGSCCAGA